MPRSIRRVLSSKAICFAAVIFACLPDSRTRSVGTGRGLEPAWESEATRGTATAASRSLSATGKQQRGQNFVSVSWVDT